MSWWLWILGGLVLLAMELFVPSGFFLCIIGLAAIITGLFVALGVMSATWLQWFFCAGLSVALVLYVRKHLLGIHVGPSSITSNPAGQTVVALSDLLPGAEGRGEMRGASWTILNVGSGLIRNGERCVVESVDGVTLRVRPSLG